MILPGNILQEMEREESPDAENANRSGLIELARMASRAAAEEVTSPVNKPGKK